MPEFSTGHHKTNRQEVILSQAGGIPVSSEHRRDDRAESTQLRLHLMKGARRILLAHVPCKCNLSCGSSFKQTSWDV